MDKQKRIEQILAEIRGIQSYADCMAGQDWASEAQQRAELNALEKEMLRLLHGGSDE